MEEKGIKIEIEEEQEDEVIFANSMVPNEKDEFYIAWGREIVKNELNLTNELLKQQITISLALLALSFIYDNILKETVQLRNIVLFAFFFALLSSFIGLMPFRRVDVWLDSPDEIEKFKKDALFFKRWCYMISAVCTILGVALIVVKVIFY